jgi:uncharacterized RDD family membrane protein YckC
MRWCSICRTNLVNPTIGRLATPGRRFFAAVADALVPFFVAFFVLLSGLAASAATASDVGIVFGGLISFALFIGYVVWALKLFAQGATPGKKLLGIRVIKEDGRHAGFLTMLFREWIGKWISGLIASLGFLWILFDRDKQGWHDKFASTYVIEAASAERRAPVTV